MEVDTSGKDIGCFRLSNIITIISELEAETFVQEETYNSRIHTELIEINLMRKYYNENSRSQYKIRNMKYEMNENRQYKSLRMYIAKTQNG